MPFVTEYNTSIILKKLIGEIPDDIKTWEPYKKTIYFLNRLDKTNLLYYKKFLENPDKYFEKIYNPIVLIDNKMFVYEGGNPSYHKVENCDRLSSNFINFKIPEEIKDKGNEAIDEFRKWFKDNQVLFTEDPEIFQMRIHAKYGILQSLEKVNYKNSGNVYKENLTITEIETRINSILYNASEYYKKDLKRQEAIRLFQKSTYLAFKSDLIPNNNSSYNDDDLKVILKEYFYLFVQPIIYYLREYYKSSYGSNIDIDEKIFEYLNFKKCKVCYADNFEQHTHNLAEKKKVLIEKFGDFEFPIEPTLFFFKEIENSDFTQAFIYCMIFRCSDKEFQVDELGNYKTYKAEFIDRSNKFFYVDTKIYEADIPNIILFRKYITNIQYNKKTKIASYRTYCYEI